MAAVRHLSRLPPLRTFDERGLRQHVTDLHRELQTLHQRIDALQGHRGTTEFGDHVDLGGNRMMNVGPTRSDHDAPNVAELRTHAMYARNGIHYAEHLILAKHGIRTLNPAKADDDLVSLGQLRQILVSAGVSLDSGTGAGGSAGGSVTQLNFGIAYPPATLIVANGPNINVSVGDAVFIRLTGPTAAFSIGGFADAIGGRLLFVYQTTGQSMTLLHEDANTTAGFRIHSGSGGDLAMDGPGVTILLYDDVVSRWVTA